MEWNFLARSFADNPLVNAVEDASPEQCILYTLLGFGAYLALVSLLRFRRRHKLHRSYPYATREAMGKMTDQNAWAIQKLILHMEFPFIVPQITAVCALPRK